MILLRALPIGGEFAHPELRRGTQRGRISLDEDSLPWDHRGELDTQIGFARDEMMGAEREIRTVLRELGHELHGPVPAVQEKAAAREFGRTQDVHQRPDGFDAMDGESALELDRQSELRPERLLLGGGIEILDPTI